MPKITIIFCANEIGYSDLKSVKNPTAGLEPPQAPPFTAFFLSFAALFQNFSVASELSFKGIDGVVVP